MTVAVEFRSLMSTFPTGVVVVTALDGGGKAWGMTCSSVCSVALDPPTLLVCLRDGSPTLAAALESGAFAVNLLPVRAKAVAELFASGAADRFDRVEWRTDDRAGGPHMVEDAHAVADCAVRSTQRIGDHVVVFGEVTRTTRAAGEARPLLYGMRRYSYWPA